MPDYPANQSRTPRPDEGDLLAFIEGEPLPAARQADVVKTLKADAVLARRVDGMRRDREAMRSMARVAAPAGLLDAVESALQPVLERQMLLGLRDGEPLESRPPVSVVQPRRRSVLGSLLAERAGRYSALAAGLLLLIGGASYWAVSYWPSAPGKPIEFTRRDGPSPQRPTEIASRQIDRETNKTIASAPALLKSDDGAGATVATAPAATTAEGAAASDTDADAPMGPFYASTDSDDAVDTAITTERAIELARENRLVIRLRSPDAGVMAQPDRVADRIRKAASPAWRLGDEAPAELAAVLNAPPVPAPETPARPEPHSPAVADDAAHAPPPPADVGPTGPEYRPPPSPTVYVVQMRLDAAAIESLINALSPLGDPTLEEAPQTLPMDEAVLNPAAVVWWSQPPAGWTAWASVPVVVDRSK